MQIIIGILLAILGMLFLCVISFFVMGAILLVPLKIRYRKKLRQKNLEELKKDVFQFAEGYFSYIGNDHKTVKEFKDLIQAQDLSGIRRNWERLSSDFHTLERKAGHTGRPLIMDYYCWYEMAINELAKRTIK